MKTRVWRIYFLKTKKSLALSYRRDSIWWIMSAKKEEIRLKRLGILVVSSAAVLKITTLRKK
jgi:hypothetical protein